MNRQLVLAVIFSALAWSGDPLGADEPARREPRPPNPARQEPRPPVSGEKCRAWEGTITIPTYPWQEDPNPRFWALDPGLKDAGPAITSLIYPYTMQDFLSRTKTDRTYKALFIENEYLKVTCLPELGGRIHSVLDKSRQPSAVSHQPGDSRQPSAVSHQPEEAGEQMFHLNRVIKPSMIAMRGAWISGGIEWNAGPQGHTVTCVSPVDAVCGASDVDGSAWLEIANTEQTQRTRWTVRLTLHPGRAYLDERIRLYNPTDTIRPYYFWNCTAFPCRAGTRFIFPMTLGTDHSAEKFFRWPIDAGVDAANGQPGQPPRDLTWLKNYETLTSIFARDCVFDFFGAYDVDADRGIVQTADHLVLPGKKAWTWGTSDFGLVAQQNLTDEDGPYIEVQSGPLPTQSDYGALWPHAEVAWQEWWYPVHGLGDGFEFATRDVAVQTRRAEGKLTEVRILPTAVFNGAKCVVRRKPNGPALVEQSIDLTPAEAARVTIAESPTEPVDIAVFDQKDAILARFTSPLPVPKVDPPDPATLKPKPDDQLSAQEACLRGRKHELAQNRVRAREYYERALKVDAEYSPALRALGGMAIAVGDYAGAVPLLERAVRRDGDDGLAWFWLGVSHFKLEHDDEALRCAYQAARRPGTTGLGYDLAGRVYLRCREPGKGQVAFMNAMASGPQDMSTGIVSLLSGENFRDRQVIAHMLLLIEVMAANQATLPDYFVLRWTDNQFSSLADFVRGAGPPDFKVLELALTVADVGLYLHAAQLLESAVQIAPTLEHCPLILYHMSYWAAEGGDKARAQQYLEKAHAGRADAESASNPESLPVLQWVINTDPNDAYAHLQLGNLCAHLGRLDDAATQWRRAAELDSKLSVAPRNLGLYARNAEHDLKKATDWYRKAIAAKPEDQTLYRDLAQVLVDDGQRGAGIRVLETMPIAKGLLGGPARRADVLLLLAQAYLDEKRYGDVLALFDQTAYFVAWEGQTTTWVLFSRAHLGRGQARFEKGDFAAALADFNAALTYPANLGVGRSHKPEHAAALYWRGKALAGLGRMDDARQAWREGAAGCEGSEEQNTARAQCQEQLRTEK